MSVWTTEQTARLRELHEAGLTAPQIAERIGVTCDMVSGKLTRLRNAGRPIARPVSSRAWTADMVAALVALDRLGKTSTLIAATLGITRGAVCGKLDRLKCANGLKPKPVRKRERQKALRASPVAIPALIVVPPPAVPKSAPEPTLAIKERLSRPFGSMFLLDLGKSDCRFPTEDHPGEMQRHRFCGRPVEPGYEYCPHHCLAAFNFVADPREKMRLQRICEDVEMAA